MKESAAKTNVQGEGKEAQSATKANEQRRRAKEQVKESTAKASNEENTKHGKRECLM